MNPQLGIRHHKLQLFLLFLMVFAAGCLLGTLRTVLPIMAETDFGVNPQSFFIITSFILAFGVVKAIMNFVAGGLADKLGKKNTLLIGWLSTLPIPWMIYYAESWNAVILATTLLGFSQGFTWSMVQMLKLDWVQPKERGTILGINEFAGYGGVALSGYITASLSTAYPPQEVILYLGLGLLFSAFAIFPWIQEQDSQALLQPLEDEHPYAARWTPWQLFFKTSFIHKSLSSLNQAGLVEKFIDALIWVIYPIWLNQQGFTLKQIGLLTACYGMTWGLFQLITGPLCDRTGRKPLIVSGFTLSALCIFLMPIYPKITPQIILATGLGLGMALLYPALLAGVADWSHSYWKNRTIAIYRFWRDLGYGIGALVMASVAHYYGNIEMIFYVISGCLTLSLVELMVRYKEYVPRTRYWRTVDEVYDLIHSESPVEILDVRTQKEYEKYHIQKSKHLPMHSILSGEEINLNPNKTYLITCQRGRKRAKRVSQFLNDLGFETLWMNGGIHQWKKKY